MTTTSATPDRLRSRPRGPGPVAPAASLPAAVGAPVGLTRAAPAALVPLGLVREPAPPGPPARTEPPGRAAVADRAADAAPAPFTLGAEEEFHVVDLASRQLAPRAAELLDRLPAEGFTAELHRSMVETNTPVCTGLDGLRAELVRGRRRVAEVARAAGLGIVAAGTVPLTDDAALGVTPTGRYQRMLEDYQLLVEEQLICGAQIHVGVPDRDEAVALVPRLAPWLPVLLALSASSPYWQGRDTGYASARSLLWQRWPTAGAADHVATAAEYDQLTADLVGTGVIADRGMLYFDVRPSAHVPTLELRLTDACPDVADVVLLAGLFRALVQRERNGLVAGVPAAAHRPAVLRAATWRASRSGLERDLVDLTGSPAPVPAAVAVARLTHELRPYLEMTGDWDQVWTLAHRATARGSSALRQRRAFARRDRLTDVVDLLLAETCGDLAS